MSWRSIAEQYYARIAKLEAERDRLKAALTEIVSMGNIGQAIRCAGAALSGEGAHAMSWRSIAEQYYARIAELEADLHKYKLDAQHALDVLGHRVHELEAERDKWSDTAGDWMERAVLAEAELDWLEKHKPE